LIKDAFDRLVMNRELSGRAGPEEFLFSAGPISFIGERAPRSPFESSWIVPLAISPALDLLQRHSAVVRDGSSIKMPLLPVRA